MCHQFGVDIWFLLLPSVGGRVTRTAVGPSLPQTKEDIVKSEGELDSSVNQSDHVKVFIICKLAIAEN